jgi:hypothetical protein
MHSGNNRERLQHEIAALIKFISDGREFFFQKSGQSLESSDDYLNWMVCMELFSKHPELTQLELNIQLFYIKLSSYYELIGRNDVDVKRARNSTPQIFNGNVKYNFFLHKVAHNLKRVMFIFYKELDPTEPEAESVQTTLEPELDSDIREFIRIWGEYENTKERSV